MRLTTRGGWLAALAVILLPACSGQAGGGAAAAARQPAWPVPYAQGRASCGSGIVPAHPLALVRLRGATALTVLDLADPAHQRAVCTLTGVEVLKWGQAPVFASARDVSYLAYRTDGGVLPDYPAGAIVRLRLPTDAGRVVVAWPDKGFNGAGRHAWAPDGTTVTYLRSTAQRVEWHLVAGGADRVLATIPGKMPLRSVTPDDQIELAFSASGRLVLLAQTYVGGGAGDGAPLQVRRLDGARLLALPGDLSDGPSPATPTMATWTGDDLYYRDGAGVHRWGEADGDRLVLPGARWYEPAVSPGGRWIAYTAADAEDVPHVHLLDLSGRTPTREIGGGSRVAPRFLTPSLLFTRQGPACLGQCDRAAPPSDASFVLDLTTGDERPSPIAAVDDVWSGRPT